jgi:hypothetical protein
MIISHKHKFIFIKTAKTAGTSMEIALSKFAGPQDVITRCSAADEVMRASLGHVGPQNYNIPLRKVPWRGLVASFVSRSKLAFYNHIGAETIAPIVGRQVWSSYYKFCFERNPWDKVVSAYYFDTPVPRQRTISEYVQSGAGSNIQGYNLYTIRGEIVVDKIYFYEDLPKALESIRSMFGFSSILELPRAKGDFRPSNTHYRDVLSDLDRVKISKVYAREIAHFDYSW